MAAVLIVEDEPELLRLMTEILTDAGHTVLEAHDGHTMLTTLHRSPIPLVVVLDRKLPDMDGLAALSQVRDARRKMAHKHAFILCTAWELTFTAEEQALLTHMQATLVAKPFHVDAFSAQVAGAAQRLAASC